MRLASIDIGTNSTRFLVADIKDNVIATVKSGLITTRLGQGINQERLVPEAMERTVLALEQFVEEIKSFQPEAVIAAATSAVRDAINREEFLELTLKKTGLKVQILSGEREAEASYQGVLAGLPVNRSTTNVLDVGGGSTEIIWPGANGIKYASLPVGAVRMTEAAYTEQKIKEILRSKLAEIDIRQHNERSLVAVGGTATTLAAMSLKLIKYQPERVHGYNLSLTELKRLLSMLVDAGAEGRKKIIGLQPQRADIILAGVIIMQTVLEALNLKGLTVSESDILQGLIIALNNKMSK